MDMTLEVVVLPVSDVDRAKEFYVRLGWRLDADFVADNDFRVVQLTPPGSRCSVIFGTGVTSAAPGSAGGLYLVVDDIEAARAELVEHGAIVLRGVLPHDALWSRGRSPARVNPRKSQGAQADNPHHPGCRTRAGFPHREAGRR